MGPLSYSTGIVIPAQAGIQEPPMVRWRRCSCGCTVQGKRKVAQHGGWHRQAQLGDGDFPGRRTIAKAFGLDDATRLTLSVHPFWGLCDWPVAR